MTLETAYETGILWQDFQHKQLVDLLQRLKEKDEGELDQEMFDHTVGFLVMYVNHHFSLEEMYMDKYEYTGLEHHIQEHREFIDKLRDFREKNKTYSEEAARRLIVTISGWVLDHILENDIKLGEFLKLVIKRNAS